ncbi:hypothetical protein [Amycolatopsis sp. NPDC051128]|uniref:hypothetical protein n=1 Tax=Amycolatopsis sp. NPDC051128 TaxID=3155412 RepID=UPI0034368DC2
MASLVMFAGVASSHECYISSRSTRGDLQAGLNSKVWSVLTVSDLAGFAPPGTDAACFEAYWLANGGPASFTVRSDKTIGEGSSNPNLSDGKGLEHAEDVYGGLFFNAVVACQV